MQILENNMLIYLWTYIITFTASDCQFNILTYYHMTDRPSARMDTTRLPTQQRYIQRPDPSSYQKIFRSSHNRLKSSTIYHKANFLIPTYTSTRLHHVHPKQPPCC